MGLTIKKKARTLRFIKKVVDNGMSYKQAAIEVSKELTTDSSAYAVGSGLAKQGATLMQQAMYRAGLNEDRLVKKAEELLKAKKVTYINRPEGIIEKVTKDVHLQKDMVKILGNWIGAEQNKIDANVIHGGMIGKYDLGNYTDKELEQLFSEAEVELNQARDDQTGDGS